jgi:lipopolysaccharide export system protein LptA
MRFLLTPVLLLLAGPALAQPLNLGGTPGSAPVPIQITAASGITWSQTTQTVTATGSAKAVRGAVTVVADELIAHYLKQAAPAGSTAPTASQDSGLLAGGQAKLSELEAVGHVHIYTATDNAWGDHATYDMNSAVLVLTGGDLKLTTPQDTVTARDSIEYYAVKRMAVARGNALIVAVDGRSLAADTITGYLSPATTQTTTAAPASQDALAAAGGGSFQRVEAVGHVVVKTQTDTATGDTGVYLPPTGMARLGGDVHVIHGPNEMEGSDALVNMKTGVATLLAGPGGQVSGVLLPSSGGAAQ